MSDANKADIDARLRGKGVYPAERAWLLLSRWRCLILPPGRLVRRLGLKPADRVLEVGPGPGYFSPSIARAIPRGKLTLFDIQSAMLAMAKSRLEANGCTNFEIVEGNAARLPFPDASFDVVFLVTVLGEIDSRAEALREFRRVLRPGGRLSVTEQFGDPDYVRFRALSGICEKAGFVLERRFGSAIVYTANFRTS